MSLKGPQPSQKYMSINMHKQSRHPDVPPYTVDAASTAMQNMCAYHAHTLPVVHSLVWSAQTEINVLAWCEPCVPIFSFLFCTLTSLLFFFLFFLMIRRPPRSTLFPYTTSSDLPRQRDDRRRR